MTRLLVTGGSGYLGGPLARAAYAAGWDVTVTYWNHPLPHTHSPPALRLDLTDAAAVEAALVQVPPAAQPTAIIHTACSSRDRDNITAIVPAARNLAAAAHRLGARLVHVSSDMVFDGDHPPYPDDAAPLPITNYGQAKAEAESVVTTLAPAAAIVRPSLIWSLDPIDRQTAWLVDGNRRGERVVLFTDEVRCPVFVDDLVAALLELAARPEVTGPLNAGGAQALTRWEFGLRLLDALGLPRHPHVIPGTVADSGLIRPKNLTLISARAASQLAARLRGVDEVLAALPSRTPLPRYCEG